MTEDLIKNSDCENESCVCEKQDEHEMIDKNQEMTREISDLQAELTAQNEKFLRLAAEYDNYRKRSEKDKISIYNDAKIKTVSEILPIADCIERAIESSCEADAEYQKGLSMLNEQFVSSLAKLGVEAFGDIGDEFDPKMHNAISHVEDEEFGENLIVKIFQKGYKLGDKIIRHAMVSVAN